jgi:hypothetical protein
MSSVGLTARLWRSCGSARKTSRIARSCRLCRRCHISRYRRTVCTAARSGTCDQRERGVRHLTAVRRATPKRKESSCASRPRHATAAWRATAQAASSARSVDLHRGAGMVAGRQGAGCVHQLAFADDAAQAELVGALEAQGRHLTEQINRCCFRRISFRAPGGVLFEIRDRRAKASPSTSRKRPPATRSSCHLGASPARRAWRRWRRCADRRRGNASRGDGAAKFFSARPARGLFLLCAHGHEAIMSAHGDAEDMKRS